MFKSFFPKPGPFFISAFIWALVAVVFWQGGGGAWLHILPARRETYRLARPDSGRWIT